MPSPLQTRFQACLIFYQRISLCLFVVDRLEKSGIDVFLSFLLFTLDINETEVQLLKSFQAK